MNVWDAVYRLAWGALIILVTIGVVVAFSPKCRTLRELQKKKAALETQNAGTEAAIMDLKVKQQQFATDPAFVERTAREVGMVKTNETIYRLSRETFSGGRPRPETPK